jgi:hypothetical protein
VDQLVVLSDLADGVCVEMLGQLHTRTMRGDVGRHVCVHRNESRELVAALRDGLAADSGLLPELGHDRAVRPGHWTT